MVPSMYDGNHKYVECVASLLAMAIYLLSAIASLDLTDPSGI